VRRYLRDPMFSRFDTIPECDGHRQTDRQTDRHTTTAYTALSKASRGKNGENKEIGKKGRDGEELGRVKPSGP